MADQPLNIVPGNEDTSTRKTVRLRPAAPVTPIQLSDPLSGRNTNTGNLAILEDTQTRRTVKLKPLMPAKAPVAATPAPAPAPAAAPAPAPAAAPVPAPAPAPAPAPVAAPPAPAPEANADGDDTSTRKSSVIPKLPRALRQPAAATPVAAAPIPDADEDEDDGSTGTVKLVRPERAPVIGPKHTPAPPITPPAVEEKAEEPQPIISSDAEEVEDPVPDIALDDEIETAGAVMEAKDNTAMARLILSALAAVALLATLAFSVIGLLSY